MKRKPKITRISGFLPRTPGQLFSWYLNSRPGDRLVHEAGPCRHEILCVDVGQKPKQEKT